MPFSDLTDFRLRSASCDAVLRSLYDHLNWSFITPIDPEDLYNLSGCLDEVLDLIEATAHKIDAYGIRPTPEMGTTLARLLQQCSERLEAVCDGLKEGGFGNRSDRVTQSCSQAPDSRR